MTLYGVDVEQLDTLASLLARTGGEAEATMRMVQSSLQTVAWIGPDADRFRGEWGEHAGRLRAFATALDRVATGLRARAEEQRRISGASGASNQTSPSSPVTSGPEPATPALRALLGFDSPNAPTTSVFGGPNGALVPDHAYLGALDPSRATSALAVLAPLLAGGGIADPILRSDASALLSSLLGEHAKDGAAGFSESVGWSVSDAGDAPWGPYAVDARAGLGVAGRFDASAGLADGQFRAAMDASVELGAYGSVDATTNVMGFAPVGVHGEAFAGAAGSVDGQLAVGPDGAAGRLGGEAFAGARAAGEGSIGIDDVGSGRVGAEVWAGVGATFDANAQLSWDRVEIGFDVGAALGIGTELNFDIGFEPSGVLDDLFDDHGLSDIVNGDFDADDALELLTGGDAISKGVKSAGSALKSVGSAVGDVLGF